MKYNADYQFAKIYTQPQLVCFLKYFQLIDIKLLEVSDCGWVCDRDDIIVLICVVKQPNFTIFKLEYNVFLVAIW